MPGLWIVMRLELFLLPRRWSMLVAAVLVALAGAWVASGVREAPWSAWSEIDFAALFVTLILTFGTGDQIIRDHTRRLDGVLLSSPVSTAVYVCGKYLATLIVLLGLVGVGLIGALLMDRFDAWTDPPIMFGHSRFPPLGPWPYISSWLLLMVTPTVFGAAFVLLVTTLTRGGRAVAVPGALLFWLAPLFFSGWPTLLDAAAAHFYGMSDADAAAGKLAMATGIFQGPEPRAVALRVIALAQQATPHQLPPVFWWNRALFLGLAIVAVVGTVRVVSRHRRGA